MNQLKNINFKAFNKCYKLLSGRGLRRVPGICWTYDFLFKSLWPFEKIIDIQGSMMYVDIMDNSPDMRETFQSYAINRIHEPSTTALFKKIVREGDTVVDFGANIGYFSLLASRLVGPYGKVHAFEPEPRNYNYLLKNISLNRYLNIVPIQKAVADSPGKVRLYICHYDTGHHTINQNDGIKVCKPGSFEDKEEFIEIEKISLDEYFKNSNASVDVIKMDAEGAEVLALLGMDEILKSNKNIKMIVEFYPLLIKKMGHSPKDFARKLLDDYKFIMYIIGDDYCMHEYSSDEDMLIRIYHPETLMDYCKGEDDHLNLFLSRCEIP